MIFWRIVGDTLYAVEEVKELGFPKSDSAYIPDEYLEKQIFSKINKYDINEYIHAPGWINRNEMNNFLISSDIF